MQLSKRYNNIVSKIKDILWPIEKEELKLFLPMALMMLCVLFNFGALRSVKDGLVIPSIGAEVISFLKLWLVLPSSLIFTIIYAKLSNVLNAEKIFYIIVSSFLSFFLIFAYLIYPNQHLYHPDIESISTLISDYPNFQWFIKIASKWSYAIMYVFSELWSVVVINLMFWQFANHIFDTNQAKRFYPILGMIGNIGLILAGNILVTFSDLAGSINSSDLLAANTLQIQTENMLKPIILSITFSGILAMVLFKFINDLILKSNDFRLKFHRADENTKTKLSLLDSLKLIMHSKYIGYIVILILCYGLVINILEGPWKSKVKDLYPNSVDYINFMGQFNIWMGTACVTFMIIGSNILRSVSWLISALLTPIMILVTGTSFFIFVIFGHNIPFFEEGINPLHAAVFAGAIQNILSKSTKYSLFDSTKEMAYIPLSLELRTKGKAAVEVVAMKVGKALGAFIQSMIFIIMPIATFDTIILYLLIIFVLVITIWLWDIKKLNQEYINLIK